MCRGAQILSLLPNLLLSHAHQQSALTVPQQRVSEEDEEVQQQLMSIMRGQALIMCFLPWDLSHSRMSFAPKRLPPLRTRVRDVGSSRTWSKHVRGKARDHGYHGTVDPAVKLEAMTRARWLLLQHGLRGPKFSVKAYP